MRLIDSDALKASIVRQCDDCRKLGLDEIAEAIQKGFLQEIDNAPTIEPERKKDVIQKFHDYQVEWLTSHCDLELEPILEEWVVRFLHDTANCYMMELDRDEADCGAGMRGEQNG